MIAVDTNVLTYLLLDGDYTDGARELFKRDADWRSESFLLHEFTNVMATSVRNRGLAEEKATDILELAGRIIAPGLVTVAHADALTLAVQYSVSAYDARFLAAARRLGVRLITEDAQLRRAAPRLTRSLNEALTVC